MNTRHQSRAGRLDHRRDRPGHDQIPHRRPPGLLGRAVPPTSQSGPRTRHGKTGCGSSYLRGYLGQAAIGAARTPTFLGERYPRSPAAAVLPSPGRRRPLPPGDHLAPARYPSRPATPTWAPATPSRPSTSTARPAATSASSKPSATPSPSPRPPDPGPTHRRTGRGSAGTAARLAEVGDFPVTDLSP